MKDPWIGDVIPEQAAGSCGFGGPDGEGPRCPSPATIHILSESAIDGLVSLSTCDVHAAIARAAGPYQSEHPFTEACVPVQTVWYPEGCRSA